MATLAISPMHLTMMLVFSKSIATMKNLFKNLMLVAVAAIAFVACESNKETATAKAEGTTYTIEVSMDDTRSMFGEMAGEAFPSQWEGNEALSVYLVNYDYYYYDGAVASIKVNESNPKTGYITFTLPDYYDYYEYTDMPAPNYGIFYAASPAESVIVDTNGVTVKWDSLKEQTPRENNVDAKAHVVMSRYEDTIYSGMNLSFKHAVAYAKMNISALPAGVEAIDAVVVKFDQMTYTLNTSYTENIWFAVKEATPATATITIVSGDKSFEKELTLNDKFAFTTGAVTGFTVDMSVAEEVVEGDGPVADDFIEVDKLTAGDYNDNKGGYKYSYSANGGNEYGDLYVYNGSESGELVAGTTYKWNSMYADANTPGFTSVYRNKTAGGLMTCSDATLEVDANGVVRFTFTSGGVVYKYKYTPAE